MVTQRRRRAWSDTRFAGLVATPGTQFPGDLLLTLTPADTKTVTRIILEMMFFSVNVDTQREFSVDLGVGVVSREAFDLGTLPDPNTVGDYPQQGWLYVATKPVVFVPSAWQHPAIFQADLKAQRKVDRGVLYMSFTQNVIVGTSANLRVYGRVRALCLT